MAADAGPHSHACATATDAECFCACHGAKHGIAHLPGRQREHGHAKITPVKAGGATHYRVVMPDGKSPGGRTPEVPKAKGAKARMADVEVKAGRELPKYALHEKTANWARKVREGLPKDRDGWYAPMTAPSDKQRALANQQRFLKFMEDEKAGRARRQAELEAEFKWRRTPKAKRQALIEADTQWARYNEYAQTYADQSDDYGREAHAASDEPKIFYPADKEFNKKPPDEWEKHLDRVLDVGKYVHQEIVVAFDRDPERKRRLAGVADRQADYDREAAADKARGYEHTAEEWKALRDAAKARTRAHAQVAAREREIVLDVIKSVRGFGNEQHHNVTPVGPGFGGAKRLEAPRPDAVERIRAAEQHFPDEWVKLSAARPLNVGATSRAYYDDYNKMVALPTPNQDGMSYSGGFGDYSDEVVVHEMGHRMERSVPGLTQLEYTYVRRRATGKDGKLEKLSNIGTHEDGYAEEAYRDKWNEPYAGKSYERRNQADPGAQSWEVFQVGLQETFGRSTHRYDSGEELQHFTLGVLATLA